MDCLDRKAFMALTVLAETKNSNFSSVKNHPDVAGQWSSLEDCGLLYVGLVNDVFSLTADGHRLLDEEKRRRRWSARLRKYAGPILWMILGAAVKELVERCAAWRLN